MLVASAPGKLLLGGEYAVLDGAPAVAMAIDRRAVVTVESSAGVGTVRIAGDASANSTFAAGSGAPAWLTGGERLGLFEAVWASSAVTLKEPLSFVLDTRGFRDPETGTKYGLGSSAALAAALAAAMAELGGNDPGRVAPEAHRRFQGGHGSGVDVACSLHGGVIEYRVHGEVSRLDWPAGLVWAVLWSGQSADTRSKLGRLARRDRSNSRRRLGEAAERLVPAFRSGDADAILDRTRGYAEALKRFDVDHRLGIFDAGHGAMALAAAEYDVVYKPCGAGGGDVGIGLASDADVLRRFVDFAKQSGFVELDVRMDPQGAVVDGGRAS